MDQQAPEIVTALFGKQRHTVRHVPADLPDALELPRAAHAKALSLERQDYPSLEEAQDLLAHMPAQRLAVKRNHAIFALAFL